WMPAWRLAEEVAAKRLSSVEVAKATLARINDLDNHLNSFLTVTPELALEQAHEAEQAVMRGDDLGPLHGVPVSIKDSLWTRGVRAHPPRAWDRRRWVRAPAGRAVRHRRAPADDRAHPELRHHRWHARVADRPDDAHRAGQCAPARRHLRARRPRLPQYAWTD